MRISILFIVSVLFLFVDNFYEVQAGEEDSKDLNIRNTDQVEAAAIAERLEKRARKNRRPKKTNRKQAVKQNNVDPDGYLEKYGYLSHAKPGVQHSPASRKAAIRDFQRMAGLRVTGVLDEATRDKMAAPRCGMPDMVPQDSGFSPPEGVAYEPHQHAAQAYYVPGYKWTKTALTWKSVNFSPDMNSGAQRRAFYNAFKYWSDVSPLKFTETSGSSPDIEIKFAYGQHEDGPGNAFDGRGGTLAHAFYPESGDTHFDESEEWTENTDRGTNLEIVAAHEFGHALGLGHSNVNKALMAPWYQGYDANFKLNSDDIQAIQSLYGASRRPPPPRAPKPTRRPSRPARPRKRPTNPRKKPSRPSKPSRPNTPKRPTKPTRGPSACTTRFDAIMQGHDGRIYAFRQKNVYRMHYWALEDGYPKATTKVFEGAPSSPGAVFYSWKSRYTYFIKGRQIWKYYGFRKVETRKVRGFPSNIQAALMMRDGRIVLIAGSKFWLFNENHMNVQSSTGRPIKVLFPGIPSHPEAATRLSDGYIYFFKGINYRKFDEVNRRVMTGYPKPKAPAWMGPKCGRGQYTPK